MQKILIVDDEWLTRLEIEEMLNDLGYEVAGQAETGAEAIVMARELNPDLILMDVEMPGEMNGIDAAREIKAELQIPIVFISGYGDPEYIEAAKEIAPFGYVMKPFDEKEVHAFVEIALSRRKLELELEKTHEHLEQTNLDLQEEIEARKKTERTLLESKKLYRDIFEKNNAVKWLADPSSGKIIDANPAACEFYQYSHEEITNLRIWDINVQSETEVKKNLASANSGEKTEFTFQHRLASGEIRDVQVYTGALESGGKKLLHSIIIDITDRMRAEGALKRAHDELERRVEIRTAELAEANKQLKKENEAHERAVETLRKSENTLNAILDATTETIVLFDRNGIVHVANQTACDRLGATKGEVIGKNLYDFFSPEVADGRRHKWHEVFKKGKPVFFEDSRAGMIFEQVAYPILGDGDQVKMVVAFANDKTDRNEAEQALRENEKHFHSFMENAKGFAVYRLKLDPENYYGAHVVFVSPSLKDLVGLSPQDEYSQWFKNVHEDDLPSIIHAQNESSQFGVPLDQEFRVKVLEGEWRWIHAIANPVFDSEGKPEYYNAIIIDVTAQKQAEQALRESERHRKSLMEAEGQGTDTT
jgi:PAS domain S-box-containing protein